MNDYKFMCKDKVLFRYFSENEAKAIEAFNEAVARSGSGHFWPMAKEQGVSMEVVTWSDGYQIKYEELKKRHKKILKDRRKLKRQLELSDRRETRALNENSQSRDELKDYRNFCVYLSNTAIDFLGENKNLNLVWLVKQLQKRFARSPHFTIGD